LKPELNWKPLGIAFDLLIQLPCFDAVEFGEVGIEYYFLASEY